MDQMTAWTGVCDQLVGSIDDTITVQVRTKAERRGDGEEDYDWLHTAPHPSRTDVLLNKYDLIHIFHMLSRVP